MTEEGKSTPQSYDGDGPYVFICYSHADSDVPDEIRRLQEQGINVWYDSGIAPGSEWSDTLARRIEDCSHFLYFVSRNSVESEPCRRELSFAQDKRKQILAVQLEVFDLPPGLHLSLSNRQIIFKYGLSESEYRSKLADALFGAPTQAKAAIAHETVGGDTGKPTIAVLPLDNMSADPEQEYFADGITEEIITKLSMNSRLLVIARHSTFTYKDRPVSVMTVAQELGVRYVVEGSVRKADDSVRITAQLLDAETNSHIWSNTYDRQLEDIFLLQSEIAQQIAGALDSISTLTEIKRTDRIPTRDMTAYDYFLRGVDCWFRMTKEENARARELFRRATELDENYADALAWLGGTYFFDFFHQWDTDPSVLDRSLKYINQAIIKDSYSFYAHTWLSNIYWQKEQFERALMEVDRSIALNPNYASSYNLKGLYLTSVGNYEEAEQALKRSIQLNPFPRAYFPSFLGRAYRLMGRYEEAINSQQQALSINPNYLIAHIELTIAYSAMNRENDAILAADEILRISPDYLVENYKRAFPHKDETQIERDMAALRKAGLK